MISGKLGRKSTQRLHMRADLAPHVRHWLLFCLFPPLVLACERKPAEPVPSSSPPKWYAGARSLYCGIPATVRFAPADDGLAAAVWSHLEGVDDVFNAYRDDSEVGRLNRAADREGVRVSGNLAEALRLSAEVHELTGGAFDVTVGPLVRLWKDAARAGRPPAPEELDAAKRACGLEKATLEGDVLSADSPGLRFDFGGIVKGLAVDEVVDMLKRAGVRSALVQVGGETTAFGASMRGRPHVIGVQHPSFPRDRTRMWTAIIDPGTGISCSTSGNYQQPVVIAGEEFCHIVDPKTGRPASTRVLSVTVVFPETGKNWLADGLSTAGVVLGQERTLALIEGLGGQVLMLVEQDGKVAEFKTTGWDRLAGAGKP